jgi:hypothetical protein
MAWVEKSVQKNSTTVQLFPPQIHIRLEVKNE